ncbi:MAG: hypothetical protein IPJ81_04320 [Chitinophagaceae bacterium]|nr:hypothetical protein [Chitinophagaceae bacterium]
MNYTIPVSLSFTKKITFVQLIFIITGFIPVTCIALNVMQFIPLHQTAFFVAIPGFLLILCLGLKYTEDGKTALKGWLAGIIAVALYDLARLFFILGAGWDDFVPHIGDWILNKEGHNGLIAYLWRYIGNGGGMGIAFMFLIKKGYPNKNISAKGLFYGLFIFTNLMFTLSVSPNGQLMMFKITALTFTGSLVGHIVYGWVLGWVAYRFLKDK